MNVINLIAMALGYIVLIMWLLGALGFADFVLLFGPLGRYLES